MLALGQQLGENNLTERECCPRITALNAAVSYLIFSDHG
jgi:hypothetical protein